MFSLASPPQGGHSAGSLTEQHRWSWLVFSELLTNTSAGQMFAKNGDSNLPYSFTYRRENNNIMLIQ